MPVVTPSPFCGCLSCVQHAEAEEANLKPLDKEHTEQQQVALITEVTESLPELIRDPFLSPHSPSIGGIKEANQTQLDQQTTAQELLTLNKEPSDPLPDQVRDPFLITASPPKATEIDQSITKSNIGSALIEDEKNLPYKAKEHRNVKNTEVEKKDRPEEEPTAKTTAIDPQSKPNPITQTHDNKKKKAELNLQAMYVSTADELLKDSLLRVVMPTIGVLTKKVNDRWK